jgi:transcriptional regulator with XRE-family HTH domain
MTPTASLERFGDRLKRLRDAAKLTQEDLAAACSDARNARQALSHWEQGRSMPRADALGQLAAKLGVSIEGLLYGIGDGAPVAEPASADSGTHAATDVPPAAANGES